MDNNSIEFTDLTKGKYEFTLVGTNDGKLIEELGFVNGEGVIHKLSDSKISTVIPEKLFLKAILGLAISITVGM